MLRGMAADGLRDALDSYAQAQDELVEARNRLARAIAGAAMSGLTKDEIVDLTGYPADRVLRICTDAGVSESS
jgi:sulfite reductase beta subunit-like hemoprotein